MNDINRLIELKQSIEDSYLKFKRNYWLGYGLLIITVGIPFLIVSTVQFYFLLCRAWIVVYEEDKEIHPGQAVGFCFIPYFNFYWNFRAYRDLLVKMKRSADNKGFGNTFHASYLVNFNPGIAKAMCVLTILLIIPYANFGAIIPVIILFYITAKQFILGTIGMLEYKIENYKVNAVE